MPELVLRDVPPETVLFVGDSRIRMFDGLVFEDRSRPGIEILTKARWRTFFRASTFFGDGRFDEYMTRLWWELRCIAHEHVAPSDIFTPFVYRQFRDTMQTVGLAPSRPSEHTIVVSCGSDLWDVEQELFLCRLVPAPTAGVGDRPDDAAAETMGEDELCGAIAEQCAPLFAGMLALRDAGFSKLFLLGCAPPSLEQRAGWTTPRMRYGVRAAFDLVYRRFGAANGIGFIPVWEALAIDGVLRDERFFIDAEHVNLDGATAMLNRVYAATNDRR